MPTIYLSMGSNLGNRKKYIENAMTELQNSGIQILNVSSLYETEPWGSKTKNWFLNVCVEAKTDFSPYELLTKIHEIEEKSGRKREKEKRYSDRTLDIDILFYDDLIFHDKNLTIPHEKLTKRAFVLVPLIEIAPDFIHPETKKTIETTFLELENVEDVFLFGTIEEHN